MRGKWRFSAVFVLLCGVAFLPFLSAGKHIFSGLGYYFAYWEINSSIFYVLRATLEWVLGVNMGHRTRAIIIRDVTTVRAITNCMLIIFMVWLLRRRRPDTESLLSTTFSMLAAFLLLGAPVYPWYVSWTVPLLCFWRIPGWTLFTFTVFAQYYVRYAMGMYQPPWWWYVLPLAIGYVPVYSLLLWQWNKWRRGETRAPLMAGAVSEPG